MAQEPIHVCNRKPRYVAPAMMDTYTLWCQAVLPRLRMEPSRRPLSRVAGGALVGVLGSYHFGERLQYRADVFQTRFGTKTYIASDREQVEEGTIGLPKIIRQADTLQEATAGLF